MQLVKAKHRGAEDGVVQPSGVGQSSGGEGPEAGRRPGARAEAQLLGVPGTRGSGDWHVGQMLSVVGPLTVLLIE